jgi:ribonuclease III
VFKHILKKIRFFSSIRKEPYLSFQKILGFHPHTIEYYQLALRHSSVSIVTESGQLLSNERLEFLGDAVINSVVTDILYRKFENEREGFLTNTRSKIVKRESLNRFAIHIGLDKHIIVTKHVNANTNKNIYGNALEALMGAIYLDYGYKQCKNFFENRILNTFVDIDKIAEDEENYKSKVIEWCQKRKLTFDFVLLQDELQDANKHLFVSGLMIEGQLICESNGSSKKESQQNTSRKAWNRITSEPDFLKKLIKQEDQ